MKDAEIRVLENLCRAYVATIAETQQVEKGEYTGKSPDYIRAGIHNNILNVLGIDRCEDGKKTEANRESTRILHNLDTYTSYDGDNLSRVKINRISKEVSEVLVEHLLEVESQ